MQDTDHLQKGQRVGPFEIVGVIGQGGMGVVYEALQVDLETRVALKTLWPGLAKDSEARQRFLREGKAASRIEHPNVVRVLGCGAESGITYLVMELLRGENLAQRLAREGRVDVTRAVEILLPIMSAVALGHERGVVHRDLKPQNIFLSKGYRGELVPKVLDFGVSKIVDAPSATLTSTSTVLGTAAYMSPEQALGKPVDALSDQYSIGLILYEMVTGRRALAGENQFQLLHAAASASIVPARDVEPSVPAAIDQVLSTLLSRAPDQRYPSVRAAGGALLPMAPPATRTLLADDFPTSGPAPSRPARSAENTPAPAQAGYTLLLPQPLDAVHSTLGRSAAQIVARRPPPPVRNKWWIAAPVLACVLVGGAVAFWGMSGPAPIPPRATSAETRVSLEPPAAPVERTAESLKEKAATTVASPTKAAAVPPSGDPQHTASAGQTGSVLASPGPANGGRRRVVDDSQKHDSKDSHHRRGSHAERPRGVMRGANESPIIN
jgi:serine/threonine-protein kinase